MTKVTVLFICISLIIRFVYPQISFSREWVRSRSPKSDRNGLFNSKMRKSAFPSQWFPLFKNRNFIHENKKLVNPAYSEFSPHPRSVQYQYYIAPHAPRTPTFRNTESFFVAKKRSGYQGDESKRNFESGSGSDSGSVTGSGSGSDTTLENYQESSVATTTTSRTPRMAPTLNSGKIDSARPDVGFGTGTGPGGSMMNFIDPGAGTQDEDDDYLSGVGLGAGHHSNLWPGMLSGFGHDYNLFDEDERIIDREM